MFLTLFALLATLSFAFIIVGYRYDVAAFPIVGFGGIFSLSTVLLGAGGITYASGFVENVTGNLTTNTVTYTQVTNHFFGFWGVIASIVGVVATLMRREW